MTQLTDTSGTAANATTAERSSYLVMRLVEEGRWEPVKTVEAAFADAAIKAAAQKNGKPEPGEYVAIPARSWKPRQVSVETETKVRVS